jgi:hypothetical protein
MKMTITRPTEVNVAVIRVNAYVRYPEDAYTLLPNSDPNVDSSWQREDDDAPTMPCLNVETHLWSPDIDVDRGVVLNWTKGVTAKIHYKVCDEFACTVHDDSMNELLEYEGYVPGFMAIDDSGYGDYIYMTIDADGKILNWRFTKDDYNGLIDEDY